MCKEIVLIEEVVGFQKTYSILDLELTNLLADIIRLCKKHLFNILDMKVLFHLLRDVPFRNENKALELLNELVRGVKHRSFSYTMKKIRQLRELIQGEYRINGSLIIDNDNNVRWDTTVSFMLRETLLESYSKRRN